MVASMPRKLSGNRACGRVLCLFLPTHLVQEINAGPVCPPRFRTYLSSIIEMEHICKHQYMFLFPFCKKMCIILMVLQSDFKNQ